MKRLIVSVVVVVAFVAYAVFSRGEPAVETANTPHVVASTTSSEATGSSGAAGSGVTTSSESTVATSAFTDGTYTGSEADTVYGAVQVEAVIEGGRITGITFLSVPTGRRESDEINNEAIPILTQEAINAQSADVRVVSGATLTSNAFMKSLQSALDQAQS